MRISSAQILQTLPGPMSFSLAACMFSCPKFAISITAPNHVASSQFSGVQPFPVVLKALSHELNLAPRNLEVLVRAQAAVAARHVRSASSRRTRSVRREGGGGWALNWFGAAG